MSVPRRRFILPALTVVLIGGVSGWAGEGAMRGGQAAKHNGPHGSTSVVLTAEDLGVEVVALRPTARGRMLDLRVRVLDPDKSLLLLAPGSEHGIYLVHEKTGMKLEIPMTNVGTMRQTTRKPIPGRVYLMMFNNPGVVSPGDEVSLVIGEKRLTGLFVAATASVEGVAAARSATVEGGGITIKR